MILFDHWFWWLLVMACLLWYSSITLYVAYRGARDIRDMFKRLGDRGNRESRESRVLVEEADERRS